MRLENLGDVMEEVEKELEEKDQVREIAIRLSREIIRLSSEMIFNIVRGAGEKTTVESARTLKSKVIELRTLLEDHADINNAQYVDDAMQEYVEAILLRTAVSGKPLPGPEELRVRAATYVMGLADLIGEFRRIALNKLMERKIKEAEMWLSSMEEAFLAISKLHYPSALVNLRRKQDTARSLIDRTLGEIATASSADLRR
ncbi:MAG: hypothetical protein QXP70_05525 [Methanomassiliicoccales archaeon]